MQPFDPPVDPAPAPEPASQPIINIDLGGLANAIVNGFRTVLEEWVGALPRLALEASTDAISALWNGLWDSGANILATPYALTIDFPPARLLGANLVLVIYAILLLAVVLLALRNLWSTISGGGGAVHDAVNNVLMGFILSSSSTLIIAQGYALTGLASDAIGRIDYRPSFEPNTLLSIGPNLLIGIFILVALLFTGWKLILKGAYRIVLLMVLTPFAPIAGALWAIPQVRWVAALYYVTMGGWLAGGFLAIGAVSLAVQLALVEGGNNGILRLVFAVALLQVAHDLMSILTKGGGGLGIPSPLGMLLSFAGGAVAGSAGAGAAAGGGDNWNGGGLAGALPSGGDQDQLGYGYD